MTFFGVNSETLSDVVADKAYSDLRTEKGPSSGNDFTDFSRIGFTVTTKAGAKVSVYADRCGLELPDGAMADGGMMRVDVRETRPMACEGSRGGSASVSSLIQSRDIMPDADLVATVEARSAQENPDWMPYFHLQHDDYITLKERCTAHIASGASGDPEGIATIQVGYDTLKLAETLKPLLEKQLLSRRRPHHPRDNRPCPPTAPVTPHRVTWQVRASDATASRPPPSTSPSSPPGVGVPRQRHAGHLSQNGPAVVGVVHPSDATVAVRIRIAEEGPVAEIDFPGQ